MTFPSLGLDPALLVAALRYGALSAVVLPVRRPLQTLAAGVALWTGLALVMVAMERDAALALHAALVRLPAIVASFIVARLLAAAALRPILRGLKRLWQALAVQEGVHRIRVGARLP